MPDLNLAESAVQPYMFEPTKGTEGEKSASGSEEDSDPDDELAQVRVDRTLCCPSFFFFFFFLRCCPHPLFFFNIDFFFI